jgi:hypothetical protein
MSKWQFLGVILFCVVCLCSESFADLVFKALGY